MLSERGPDPKEKTLRILCGEAAGMCQYEGCLERLFYDDVTASNFNASYVAHIVASSSNGPRGCKDLSHVLSDQLSNLMLMCDRHHRLIDNNPEIYSAARLAEMKRSHQEKIGLLCELLYVPETEVVLFSSPIKGKAEVSIETADANRAVLPTKKASSSHGRPLRIVSDYDYRSREYWEDAAQQLRNKAKVIEEIFFYNPSSHVSVFPFAPIPLIALLGEVLGDKLHLDVYQRYRDPDSWSWQSEEITNEILVDSDTHPNPCSIAIVLALSSDISIQRIRAIKNYDSVYKISFSRQDVDCIRSRQDLKIFWKTYLEILDQIKNEQKNVECVDLYPAIPVSAAFEIGRRHMPGVHLPVRIFDEDNGFFETLTIGDNNA